MNHALNRKRESPAPFPGTTSGGDLWRKAIVVASRAHRGSRSVKLGAPYIAHPMRVAMTIALEFGCADPAVLAAALLHDVIEKSEVRLEEITEEFGSELALWVMALSKLPGRTKESYWEGLKRSPWQVRLIKASDVMDHLDCPMDELASRIRSGEKALSLLMRDGEELSAARERLAEALIHARSRLETT